MQLYLDCAKGNLDAVIKALSEGTARNMAFVSLRIARFALHVGPPGGAQGGVQGPCRGGVGCARAGPPWEYAASPSGPWPQNPGTPKHLEHLNIEAQRCGIPENLGSASEILSHVRERFSPRQRGCSFTATLRHKTETLNPQTGAKKKPRGGEGAPSPQPKT